jgi:conjugative transposon TraN protein
MKQIVSLICVFFSFFICRAQVWPSSHLLISTNKTTSIIFPYAIKHVDRGTKDVLVQQVNNAENLLLVKASTPKFKETNLSVITADGQLYSFIVTYDSMPALLVYKLDIPKEKDQIVFEAKRLNEVAVEEYARQISDNKKIVGGLKSKQWEMKAVVKGIYIKGDVLFYHLELENQSSIDYDIDFIRFYIRDKTKAKRTAVQEIDLKPLCIVGNIESVKGASKNNIVVALEKFTIPDGKYLDLEIMERNGGRHLNLKIGNNKIVKAKLLSETSAN